MCSIKRNLNSGLFKAQGFTKVQLLNSLYVKTKEKRKGHINTDVTSPSSLSKCEDLDLVNKIN